MAGKIKYKIARRKILKDDRQKWGDYVPPDDLELLSNVIYGPERKWNTADIFFSCNTAGKLPVIIVIHGGGYALCDKSLDSRFSENLAHHGFSVVNMNYRLAPEFHYPAPLEDINMLLFALAENASRWHADEKNVFITGDSAGAQLTFQYALMKSNAAYGSLFDFEIEKDCCVRAIAPSCGLYDLRYVYDDELKEVCTEYAAAPENLEKIYGRQLFCTDFLNENFPPAFVITSYYDMMLRYAQPLCEDLRRHGTENELHIYGSLSEPEIGHSFNTQIQFDEAKRCANEMCAFFKTHIKNQL